MTANFFLHGRFAADTGTSLSVPIFHWSNIRPLLHPEPAYLTPLNIKQLRAENFLQNAGIIRQVNR